jgi:hypothetical protein
MIGEVAEAEIVEEGREVRVRMAGGYLYRIPVDYAWSWDLDAPRLKGLRAVKCEVESDGHCIEVFTDHGKCMVLSVTSILCGCDPSYEHFGGWTEKAVENVKAGFAEYGPFLVEPK